MPPHRSHEPAIRRLLSEAQDLTGKTGKHADEARAALLGELAQALQCCLDRWVQRAEDVEALRVAIRDARSTESQIQQDLTRRGEDRISSELVQRRAAAVRDLLAAGERLLKSAERGNHR